MPRHFPTRIAGLVLLGLAAGTVFGAAVDAQVVIADAHRITAHAPAMGRLVLKDTNGREGESLEIRELRVHMRASGPVALTEIEQTFYNPTYRQAEGTFYFAVPPGASLCRLAMYVDGVLVEGELVERGEARAIYESIVRRMRDPALMEWQDGSIFKTRIFPIPARGPKRILISYTQLLPTRYGQRQYVYPLVGKTTQAVPIGRFEFTAEIDGLAEQIPVRVPSWPDAAVRYAEGQAKVRIERKQLQARSDVAVSWSPVRSGAIEAYPYRRAGEDGFLLLSYLPGSGSTSTARRIARDVVLLFDTSLSRRPDDYRIQLMIAREVLRDIGSEDRVAVISFDVAPRLHTKGFVQGSEAERVVGELNALAPLGGTNLGAAFVALDRLLKESKPRGIPDIVLLSDGIATLGETNAGRLLKQADGLLSNHLVHVHAVTAGQECERRLLQGLARGSGGLFRTISAGEDYRTAIGDLLFDLQGVILPTPKLECSGVTVRDVLPREMDAVVEGEECFLLGRYSEAGTLHVAFRHLDDSVVERDVELKTQDGRFGYVPRLWAREQLDVLLNAPQTEDPRKQIIKLSHEFTLITPYTSFLVLESEAAYARYGLARRTKRPIWGAGGLKSAPPPEELKDAPLRPVRRPVERQPKPAPEPERIDEPQEPPVEPPFLARFNPCRLRSYGTDSRVLATALNSLSLEIYYRYLPIGGGGGGGGGGTVSTPAAPSRVTASRPVLPMPPVLAPARTTRTPPAARRNVMQSSDPASAKARALAPVLRSDVAEPRSTASGDTMDAISDVPLGGVGFVSAIGLGGGGGGRFGHRFGGGRRRLVARGGGSRATETGVFGGLRWLAENQALDGSWGGKIEETSLSLLAFLGAGHSERVGQYKDNVRRSVAWLKVRLGTDGQIGVDVYEQALAVTALAEASGMANVLDTKTAAQKSVDHLCKMRGWGDPRWPDAIDNAWVVMALKSAKVAGLSVSYEAFEKMIRYLNAVQDDRGMVKSTGQVDLLATACAGLARQFLGWKHDDDLVVGSAVKLDEQVVGTDLNRPDGLYLRYFGTLVTFQQGGDIWKRWNEWNKALLAKTQHLEGETAGSWDPKGVWFRGLTHEGAFDEKRREALAQVLAVAIEKPEDEPTLKAFIETLAYVDDLRLLKEMLEPVDLHKNIRVLLLLRLGLVREDVGLHTAASRAYLQAYRLSGQSGRILPLCVRTLRLTGRRNKALDLVLKDMHATGAALRWEVKAAVELMHELHAPEREVSEVIVGIFTEPSPLRNELFVEAARQTAARDDWPKAADLYGRVYLESGRQAQHFDPYVQALARAGRWDTIAELYRKAFMDSGRSADLFEPYTRALANAGLWDEASDALAGALRVGYQTPAVFRGLSEAYRKKGVRKTEYLRAATCELEAFPGEKNQHTKMAALLLDFGDFQGALAHQLTAARLGHFNMYAYKRLVREALLAGEYEMAGNAIDEIVKRDAKLLAEWEDSTGQITEWLRRSKDPKKAAAFRKRFQEIVLRRDLVVRIFWNDAGADVDLHITEPDGTECSYQNMKTPNGGFLTSDRQRGPATETYVLREAKPGQYRVEVELFSGNRQVDVRVEVVRHKGTEREKRYAHRARCVTAKRPVAVRTIEVPAP